MLTKTSKTQQKGPWVTTSCDIHSLLDSYPCLYITPAAISERSHWEKERNHWEKEREEHTLREEKARQEQKRNQEEEHRRLQQEREQQELDRQRLDKEQRERLEAECHLKEQQERELQRLEEERRLKEEREREDKERHNNEQREREEEEHRLSEERQRLEEERRLQEKREREDEERRIREERQRLEEERLLREQHDRREEERRLTEERQRLEEERFLREQHDRREEERRLQEELERQQRQEDDPRLQHEQTQKRAHEQAIKDAQDEKTRREAEYNRRMQEAADKRAQAEATAAIARAEADAARAQADAARALAEAESSRRARDLATPSRMEVSPEEAAHEEARQRLLAEEYTTRMALFNQHGHDNAENIPQPRAVHYQDKPWIPFFQQLSAPQQSTPQLHPSVAYGQPLPAVTIGPARDLRVRERQANPPSISALGRGYRPGPIAEEPPARPISSISSMSYARPVLELPTGNEMPPYTSESRALTGRNARSFWTISEAAYPLNTPDIHIEDAEPGHLHFHTNILTSKARLWMLNADLKWEDVTRKWRHDFTKESENQMLAHPIYIGLRLTINPDYKPNWIKFSSWVPKLKTVLKDLEGSVEGIAKFPEEL